VISVPSRAELLENIVAILSDQTGVQFSGAIDENTRMFADLGLASIDAVVLSETLQKRFDRTLPFNLLMAEVGRKSERDLSIGELIEFLTAHL
jgi:acyl carrier protein